MDTCGSCNKVGADVEMRMFDSGSAVGMQRLCEGCFIQYIEKTGFTPIADYADYCEFPQHTAHHMTLALTKKRDIADAKSKRHWVVALINLFAGRLWK